jgi:hypothetical protein
MPFANAPPLKSRYACSGPVGHPLTCPNLSAARQWVYAVEDLVATIRIRLISKHLPAAVVIDDNVPNSGSYTWAVPSTLPEVQLGVVVSLQLRASRADRPCLGPAPPLSPRQGTDYQLVLALTNKDNKEALAFSRTLGRGAWLLAAVTEPSAHPAHSPPLLQPSSR